MKVILILVAIACIIALLVVGVLVVARLLRSHREAEAMTAGAERVKPEGHWRVEERRGQQGDLYVDIVKVASFDGAEYVWERINVDILDRDLGNSFEDVLDEARTSAQRRCRTLNARLDTSPGA